jgi:uncharacterized protein DUF5916
MRSQDERLTRGGPSMERPAAWEVELEGETNDALSTRGDAQVVYGRNEDGGLRFVADLDLTVQPAPRWQLSAGPRYEREVGTQQYITTLPGGGEATYGRRYVFGHIDRSTYSMQVRFNYTFKPDLTLDLYAEPFSASGRYDHIGELAAGRGRTMSLYGADAASGLARDFNVRSFRSNLVLRWEYRPGSTLYLVWQQDREAEEVSRLRTTPGQMFTSFGVPGQNRVAVKATYWIAPQ